MSPWMANTGSRAIRKIGAATAQMRIKASPNENPVIQGARFWVIRSGLRIRVGRTSRG